MKHSITIVLILPLLACVAAAATPTDWDAMRLVTPRHYVCHRAAGSIQVDGKADEPAWADVPWTEDFVDIEGAAKAAPPLRTRAKMTWDEEYLYVYAELQEPHVWGSLTHKNDLIFLDNAVEVFINPDGNNHNYYEFEVNALNTTWELTLNRAYRDNGPVHAGTNLDGLKSAVHVDGTLNDPSDEDRGWSVEIAFPWKSLTKFAPKTSCPPKDGDQWRITLSRVDWQKQAIGGKYQKIEDKPGRFWLWSPHGVNDMHRPERFGYVQFSSAAKGGEFREDVSAPARDELMDVYYRQQAFKKRTGRYARTLEELELKDASSVRMSSDGTGYEASIELKKPTGAARAIHVRQDSLIWEDDDAAVLRPIKLMEGVVISRVTRGGRSAIPVDPVVARLAGGEFKAPKDGDMLEVADGRSATWQTLKAADNGSFSGPALTGGYLYFPVNVPTDCIMLLEAAGNGVAYVNGVPRAGDPYGYGSMRLPVALHAGSNDLLFSVGRGQFRATLLPPRQSVALDTADPTLPDLLTDDHEPLWGAVVVTNATDKPLEHLRLLARFGDADVETTDVPTVPPLTIRKVPFRIPAPPRSSQEAADVILELLGEDGAIDTAAVGLRVRKPNEIHKRTFVSRIDGSVQYYAVNPAQKPSPSNALILTLHGASVEALGQASAYGSKDWAMLVAPTNRRPYGFDWEDIGERDALEVLDIAKKTIPHDPRRVLLAGHSMGGHGTWHVGLTYPDLFAAIGPSAGWSSFTSYVGRRTGGAPTTQPSATRQLFTRANSTGDTLALVRNAMPQEVYILHGSDDDNVPVTEARLMRQALDEIHHPRLSYHEQPGAGHWWGNPCVDWPPLFAVFDEARLPEPGKVNQIDFVTMNPAVSSRFHWLAIEQQIEPLKPSRVKLDRDGDRIHGTSENVQMLTIDLPSLGGQLKSIELDGQKVEFGDHDASHPSLAISRKDGRWTILEATDARQKNARRSGPFKLAYDHRMMLVYGTQGGPQEKADAYHAARLFTETLYYRGNGAVDCVPDTEFDETRSADRNVILFGNADSNAAWSKLLKDCPVQVRTGAATVGDRTINGADLAALFVYPRSGDDDALVAAVTWTGHEGAVAATALPLLVSGAGFPDWMVIGADCLRNGFDGVRGSGFFANDWSLAAGDTVMNGKGAAAPNP